MPSPNNPAHSLRVKSGLGIIHLVNNKKITAEPTDTPSDVEIRVFDSGSGAVRLYVFAPGSEAGTGSLNGWWQTANLTTVG